LCSSLAFSRLLRAFLCCTYRSSRSASSLSLHDALPISGIITRLWMTISGWFWMHWEPNTYTDPTILKKLIIRIYWDGNENPSVRSEEHTSELQSRFNLVCRLRLEKKNN